MILKSSLCFLYRKNTPAARARPPTLLFAIAALLAAKAEAEAFDAAAVCATRGGSLGGGGSAAASLTATFLCGGVAGGKGQSKGRL